MGKSRHSYDDEDYEFVERDRSERENRKRRRKEKHQSIDDASIEKPRYNINEDMW